MKKTEILHIRCTQKQKNTLKRLAIMYADGNISEMVLAWVIDGGHRQFVKPRKRKKKGPQDLS